MTREELVKEIRNKQSFLCVGLDTDLNKIPKHLLETEDPVFEFNKAIIDATKDVAVAYKPNIAFYECLGPKGWESLKKTIDYIPQNCFVIADAKRGDIGNTSHYYAKTFFEYLDCDAVTVAPYMGEDSVTPFQEFENKWVILLALTSNAGALDFQFITDKNGEELYKKVLKKSSKWGDSGNLMYVVGATRAEGIGEVRKLVPDHFFLVPGVGAQGGSLQDVANYGWNKDCGLLVNASRSVLYASSGTDFAEKAAEEAQKLQQEMKEILEAKKLLIMELQNLKEQLAETIRAYHQKGWSPATSTNYSFRIPENHSVIYVSRSGIDKSQFTADDFMEVDFEGRALEGYENMRPSAETLIHCVLYRLFPEMNCILHSHSVYSVLHSAVNEAAVGFEGYEVLKGYDGITTHETTVSLPVFDNSQDMEAFSALLERESERLKIPAFIMRKHGTYAWGKNLFEAKRHLETTEYLLEVEWKLKCKSEK